MSQAAEACPAYPVTHYSLTLTTDATSGDANETNTHTSTSTTVIVEGIGEDAVYNYSVKAHNAIGTVTYDSGVFCKLPYTSDKINDPR